MTRTAVQTDRAPSPLGSYSQGIVAGGMLYTAGVLPIDLATGSIVVGAIGEQTALVMEHLAAILEAAGTDFSRVVRATVHLADLARDAAGFDAVYRSYLTEPFPVRTTVGSALRGALVEIDVIAELAG